MAEKNIQPKRPTVVEPAAGARKAEKTSTKRIASKKVARKVATKKVARKQARRMSNKVI
jgi:hypothetical protein